MVKSPAPGDKEPEELAKNAIQAKMDHTGVVKQPQIDAKYPVKAKFWVGNSHNPGGKEPHYWW